MAKLTKNRKISIKKVDSEKAYSVEEASSLVKEVTTTKFQKQDCGTAPETLPAPAANIVREFRARKKHCNAPKQTRRNR